MQIILLGTHHSGASLVARLLNLMGVYFAPEGMISASVGSSRSTSERRDIRDLHDILLQSVDCDWKHVSHFELAQIPESVLASFTKEARKIVMDMDAFRPWFINDPRLCLLSPLWLGLLELPVCLHVHRDPVEIARSLQEQHGLDLEVGVALWEKYAIEALRAAAGKPTVRVDYSRLLEDPAEGARKLRVDLESLGVRGLKKLSAGELRALIDFKEDGLEEPGEIEDGQPLLSPGQIALAESFREGRSLETKWALSTKSAEILTQLERQDNEAKAAQALFAANNDMEAQALKARDEISLKQQQLSGLKKQFSDQSQIVSARARQLELTRAKATNMRAARKRQNEFFLKELVTLREKVDANRAESLKRLNEASAALKAAAERPSKPPARIDIVICVYNALEDVRRCLDSLVAHHSHLLKQVILVNDGSDAATTKYLREITKTRALPIVLLESAEPTGYTKAANRGLRATASDYVILLNSDTIVTPGWMERLVACGESDRKIGIIGPLSNAASWQSVPERFGAAGDWLVNDLPPESSLDRLACVFTNTHQATYPRVPLVNGFCFAIKREVMEAIGLLDEEAFPRGYGEENDFCLRAGRAGFTLAIADDCYVFHAKSKSYSHETRRELAKASGRVLKERYGAALQQATTVLRDSPELEVARKVFERTLGSPPCNILFLANFRGAGGGIHSIIQEACGLRALGLGVQVAIRARDEEFYRKQYPGIPPQLFYVYLGHPQLACYARGFDVVTATLFTGVRILAKILQKTPAVAPCYYIQDYEPRFFESSDPYHAEASESYTLIPKMRCFAKTQWLCDTIRENHGIDVYKVRPSIDREVYFADETPKPGRPFVISAMVRPKTERRSPQLTFDILRELKLRFGDRVDIEIFGAEASDDFFARQPNDFVYSVRGILKRQGVAALLRRSALFIDASSYQAFGRTGLEAMACRCATILPTGCGTSEYAVDGVNTLLIESNNLETICAAAGRYLADEGFYQTVIEEGLKTAFGYSVEDACRSEMAFFESVRTRVSTGQPPETNILDLPHLAQQIDQ